MKDSNSSTKFRLKKVFKTDSFIEKISLLIITAIISGFLIPHISNEIQRNKLKNDLIFQSQSRLLNDLTRTLIKLETLALDVSYFQTENGGYNEISHRKAYERYSNELIQLIADMRVAKIESEYLISKQVKDTIQYFEDKFFSIQDTPINVLYSENTNSSSNQKWHDIHQTNISMYWEVEELIAHIAEEIKITKNDIK